MAVTVVLLTISNIFMTIAWYWHLRFHDVSLWKVIALSWSIALIEYCIAVPANRVGMGYFSAYQLKILQEVITVIVFVGFAMVYLGVSPKWNHFVAFLFICGAVAFGMIPEKTAKEVAIEKATVAVEP